MAGLPVTGVLETCLYVDDVARSRAFYERLFGFDVLTADTRIAAFDVAPGHVLIPFRRGGTTEPVSVGDGFIPPHDGGGPQHFAFGIRAEDWQAWLTHLAANGIDVESTVEWRQGGRSLISATRTACWWNWRRRACGETTEGLSIGAKRPILGITAGLSPRSKEPTWPGQSHP